jgi:hypothetical protein
MTENNWETCADPQAMLDALHSTGKATERKLRLFAVACCRRIWHLIPDPLCRAVVEMSERYADGMASREELAAAMEAMASRTTPTAAEWEADDSVWVAGSLPVKTEAEAEADCAVSATGSFRLRAVTPFTGEEKTADAFAREAIWKVKWSPEALAEEGRAQCRLLRDLFGNPLRPVTAEPI